MEKLSASRVKGLEFASFTRGVSLFREGLESKLQTLSVGEGLRVDRADYSLKSQFQSVVASINGKAKKTGDKRVFGSRTLKDKVGWVIIRVK